LQCCEKRVTDAPQFCGIGARAAAGITDVFARPRRQFAHGRLRSSERRGYLVEGFRPPSFEQSFAARISALKSYLW
jgi:hypothetical protein